MVNCYRCGIEMLQTDITPVGPKPPDPVDNFYYRHPPSDCIVFDYIIKVGYRA